MQVFEIQDKFNPAKVWVIKRTKCSHYYVNQKINGKLFYDSFQKMRLKSLKEIGLEF